MKTLRFLIVFTFLFAGCTTTTPAPTAVIAEPSATIAPLSTATEAVALPTATTQPTDIAATSTLDATREAQASILQLVSPCKFPNPAFSYSPNKTWAVVTCTMADQGAPTSNFARVDGSQYWSISFRDVYITPYRAGDVNMSKLRQQSFIPVHWTKNEDFVYLAVPTVDEKAPYKGYDGLFRLDLSTGKTSPVLRPATAPLSVSYDFKFSPGGTKLAHMNQSLQSVTIVIVDTGTGEENRITLDGRFTQGGGLLWSPDEKQLIVSAFDANANGGHALIVYDFETKKNEYIIQQSANTYVPLEWLDANTIYAESYPGKWVNIDLVTKEVTEASALTPVP